MISLTRLQFLMLMITSSLSSSLLLNSQSHNETKFVEADEDVEANGKTGSSSIFGFMVYQHLEVFFSTCQNNTSKNFRMFTRFVYLFKAKHRVLQHCSEYQLLYNEMFYMKFGFVSNFTIILFEIKIQEYLIRTSQCKRKEICI